MKLSDEELRTLMNYRNILNYFYELWLKKTDSQYAEMERHVAAEMKNCFLIQERIQKGWQHESDPSIKK